MVYRLKNLIFANETPLSFRLIFSQKIVSLGENMSLRGFRMKKMDVWMLLENKYKFKGETGG